MRKSTNDKHLEFGKRGRSKAAPAEPPMTSLERLKQIGQRWWGKPTPKKKDPGGLGFKRSRLDT